MKLLVPTLFVLAAAAAAAAPMGTAWTWQGSLAQGGVLVDGPWDLQLTLYDAPDGAVPVVPPLLLEDVDVSAGRVAVALDFGAVLDGSDLWVQVAGRPGASSGDLSVLAPRQPLGSTPYALYASDAGTALEALLATSAPSASTLDGQTPSYYLAWANLTGVPSDLADGDDDALPDLICSPGELATWSGTGWSCDADDEIAYARTVVVGPVGDDAANGAALLAAVDALPTPTSAAEGWLVRVDAGVYDLGTATLMMKPWTVVAGADRRATLITSARCCDLTGSLRGTVHGAAHAELRDLTVLNTCAPALPDQQAAAVSNTGAGAVFRRLVAFCPGAAAYDFGLATTGSDVIVDNVYAVGGSDAAEFGVGLETAGTNTLLIDSSARGTHTGLRIYGDNTRVLRGSYGATDSGLPTFDPHAIEVEGATNVQIADVSAEAATAIYATAYTSSASVILSRLLAHGVVHGRANAGTPLMLAVEHSRISTGGPTIDIGSNVIARVAATQLSGDTPVVIGGGIVCAGVWDERWSFFANVCP